MSKEISNLSKVFLNAAETGNIKTLREILLELGKNATNIVNTTNSQNQTALMLAAMNGHTEILEILKSIPGIDINKVDNRRESALMLAVKFGQEAATKTLASIEGIDFNIRDSARKESVYDFVERFVGEPKKSAIKQLLPIRLDQAWLIDQFREYLQLQGTIHPEKYQKINLDKLLTEIPSGQCSGLSGLWLYHMSHDTESLFLGNLRLISQWDRTQKSLAANKNFLGNIFEQMLNDIQWANKKSSVLTHIKSQTDLVDTFETIKQKEEASHSLAKEFSLIYNFNYNQLEKMLEENIFDRKLIHIISSVRPEAHSIGIMLVDNIYWLYDSILPSGPMPLRALAAVQAYLENALFPGEPLAFNIFERADQFNPNLYHIKGPEYISLFLKTQAELKRQADTLLMAANYGDIGMVQALVDQNRILNRDDLANQAKFLNAVKKELGNSTPLILAAISNHAEVIRILLAEPGINILCANSDGNTALSLAAHNNNIESVRALLTTPNPELANMPNNEGFTPLMRAIYMGHAAVTKILLATPGIDILRTDLHGDTALSLAVRYNNIEVVRALLTHPSLELANKSIRDDFTPLILASGKNRAEIAKILTAVSGINLDAANSGQITRTKEPEKSEEEPKKKHPEFPSENQAQALTLLREARESAKKTKEQNNKKPSSDKHRKI